MSNERLFERIIAEALKSEDTAKIASTHLALSALSHLLAKNPKNREPTVEQLTICVKEMLPPGTELSEDVIAAIGEVYVHHS